MYCEAQSKNQVRYFFKAIYKETEGLGNYFRLPISIQNCVEVKIILLYLNITNHSKVIIVYILEDMNC